MSENLAEVDAMTTTETQINSDDIEKTLDEDQTFENNEKTEIGEGVQLETQEKQTTNSLEDAFAVEIESIERTEHSALSSTETGEAWESGGINDTKIVKDAAVTEDSEAKEVNGDSEMKSESEHEGEVEVLEEPEECDSSNEMIIGGDVGVIDSESESRHHHKKNRRRIVVDESDDSGAEVERLRSCTPENPKQTVSSANNSDEEEEVPSEKEEKDDEDSPVEEIIDPAATEIIAKERPGPKSKKSSDYLKLEQNYETRHLFKNAIIIPAVEKKKKKKPKRVLASEDEESDEKSREPDVSGIGIEEPMDDDASRLSGANILLSENYSVDPNFIPLEGVQVDAIPEIIPLDNPILPQNDEEDLSTSSAVKVKREVEDVKPNLADLQQDNFLNPDKSPEYGTLAPIAPSNVTDFPMDDTSGAPTILADLSDNNKAPQLLVIKKEPDMDQKASEQFLADALRAQFTDQAPKSIKQLDASTAPTTTEIDPNTTFWGRDSSSSSSEEEDWTANMWTNVGKKQKSYHYSTYPHKSKKRKRDRYASSSESESSDSDNRNRRKNSKKSHHIKKTIYLHKQNQTLRTAIKGYSKKDIKKKVNDRFFDRSLLIPNDIYFGDTKVPDHVLHAYNSDALTSSDSDDAWFKQVMPQKSKSKYSSYKSYSKPKTSYSSHSAGTVSPSGDSQIQLMKNYLKAAGIKKVKFSKLWEGCKSNNERANAMLRLLRDKGLVGDPTMAKCRELKMKMQAKREIDELDTSVIIDSDSEDGNRRIHTRRTARKNYTEEEEAQSSIPPESVQTLNKLKKVIDTDSD